MLKFNLVEFLKRNSVSDFGIHFIQSNDRISFLSYGNLLQDATQILHALHARQIRKGDELIFQLNDNRLFIKTFWACILGGIIPVPLHPALNSETRLKLSKIWNELNHPAIIADPKTTESLQQKLAFDGLKGFSEKQLLIFDDGFPESFETEAEIEDPEPGSIAFIQFSSGSTGNPKGVVLTHENLVYNIDAIIEGAALTSEDSTLGWMPLTHDLGLIGFHLTPLVCGIDQYIIDTEVFVRRPGIWIDKLHEHQVSFTASPNFGYKHVLTHFNKSEAKNWNLSCVKRILNGAEPISVEVAENFLSALAPYGLRQECMFPVYGMAEASLAITFPNINERYSFLNVARNSMQTGGKITILDNQSNESGIRITCVGQAVKNCEVQIFDEQVIPLGENQVGSIYIRGRNVSRGYYNNPIESEKTITENGWLNTGDLGFFHEEKLYITGRSKDIIFSNGLNLYPHDLERVCEEIDGIYSGRIVFTGIFNPEKGMDELICFTVYRGQPEKFVALSQEIRQLISKKIALEVEHIIPVNAIPKTTSGKVQRYILAEQFREGIFTEILNELNALSEKRPHILPENKVQATLMEMWNSELNDSIKSIRDNFFEFGGNSLKASLLLGQVAKQFQVELSIREFFKHPTVELLAALIGTKNTEEFIHIPVISNRQHYPCSSAQKRLYILHQLDPDKTNYNITTVHKILGDPDLKKLQKSFRILLERHEILRSNFVTIQGEAVQLIRENLEIDWSILEIEAHELEARISELIRPYKLENEALFRLKLIKIKEKSEWYLFFDIQHILMDGFSLNQLVLEFRALYNEEEPEAKAISYKDFAVWEQEFLKTAKIREQENFWLNEFRELPPVLELQSDFRRNKFKEKKAESVKLTLDQDIHKLITKTVEKHELTYFNLFISVYALILYKYTGNKDIVIGTPVINRPHVDLRNTLGTFINTLALRTKPEGKKTISAFLQEIKEKSIDIFSNQNYPFELLIEKLNIERNLNRNPLFDVFFVFQNANEASIRLNELEVEKIPTPNAYTKFDLNIHAEERNGTFELLFEYDSELFKKETIEHFSAHFRELILQVCHRTSSGIAEINPIGENELDEILSKSTGRTRELSTTNALEKFLLQVRKNPSRSALKTPEKSFTYQEIDAISNHYAQKLLDFGVEKNQLIGISFSAYEKVIFAVLACWKTGTCYVPIDPGNPAERNAYIIRDANLKIIFSEQASTEAECIDINVENSLDKFTNKNPGSADFAYLIYTSGTTGNPKGTIITHTSLVNYTDFLAEEFQINEEHSSVLLSSYAFDLGYTSLFGCLLNGGCLHILKEEDRKEPAFVLKYVLENKLTYLKTTPSQLFTFLNSTQSKLIQSFKELKYLFVGGEAIKTSDLELLEGLNPGIRVINHYGPTEATIGCITKEIRNLTEFTGQPTIGSAIQNTSVYLLNQDLQVVPDGVCGELAIAGAGLSHAYLNNEVQTSEKFIRLDSGIRVYRTGDLAKRLPNGELVLLGRNDDQVKIRGYRVELAEIEKTLKSIFGIQEAVVLAAKDKSEQDEILAYVVSENTVSPKDIKNILKRSLPAFMIPEKIFQIREIPLTANGKLDKPKLPTELNGNAAGENQVDFSEFTDSQKKLQHIWKDLLKTGNISLQDNFFNLGGHSLKASILVSKIHKEFEIELRLKDIFEYPTLEELDQYLKTQKTQRFISITKAEKKEFYPLTSAQQRMYILHQIKPESLAYNMPGAFVVSGKLDLEHLKDAFHQLIERHESLRTRFEVKGEHIRQYIQTDFSFEIEKLLVNDDPESTIKAFIRPFELNQAPLFRVGVAQLKDSADHLLVFDIHHIISDGSSMGIIIQDFTQIYDGTKLEALAVQYADFAVWQENEAKSNSFKEQKNYWVTKFHDQIPLLDLETDFLRPNELKSSGSNFTYQFNSELTKKMRAFTERHRTTLFIALTSFYSLLLAKKTRQEDLVIGTPVAGRSHADLQKLIGVFLNMLPLRIKLDIDITFSDFIKANHEQFIADFGQQHFPFDRLIDELDLERSLNRNPLFDTMLVLQNMDLSELKTKELLFKPLEFNLGFAQLDLSLIVFENTETIDFNVIFNTELFKRESILLLMNQFEILVEKILVNDKLKLKNYDLLTGIERQQLISDSYLTKTETQPGTIAHAFSSALDQYPDRVAVHDFERELSYREVKNQILFFQEYLRNQGIKAGDVVAVHVETSVDVPGIVYAVLAYGAIYLPIDPMYPEQRIRFMLKDSDCKLLITNIEGIPFDVNTFLYDTQAIQPSSLSTIINNSKAQDIAYINYTSGTTGTPKGVQIRHDSLLDYVLTFNELMELNENDCVMQVSSLAFDLSVEELFPSILKGARIFIVNHKKDLNLIVKAIESGKPTILTTSPLVLNFINQSVRDYGKMRHIVSGGDVLKNEYISSVPTHIQLWNGYGPTESTVFITVQKIDRSDERITLGKPIRNRHVLILDKHQNMLPKGMTGELCVSGIGLAEGYLNSEEQTRSKFIDHPYRKNEKLYRTGDLARWNENQELEYLGRIDKQVKIRGYRIELGEITHALLDVDYVSDCHIRLLDIDSEKTLVAYYTSENVLNEKLIIAEMAQKLPAYMIPSHFVHVAVLPINQNGKIDEKALPELKLEHETDSDDQLNDLELVLSDAIKSLLKKTKFAINTSFFEAGGDSIKAIQLVNSLQQKGYKLEVKQIFEAKSVRELATYLKKSSIEISQDEQTGAYPLTPIQREFFEVNYRNPNYYNQSFALKTGKRPDLQKVEQICRKIIAHHDVLRSVFTKSASGWEAKILAFNELELQAISETEISTYADLETEILKTQAAFKLDEAPLFTCAVYHLNQESILFFACHHLVVDAVSWRIILEDFIKLYSGEATEIQAKTNSIPEFSKALLEYAKHPKLQDELNYWQSTDNTENGISLFELKDETTGDSAVHEFEFDEEATQNLLFEANKVYNTKTDDLLLCALSLTFSEWKNRTKIKVDLEGHGRESFDEKININRTVGWFTTIFPIQLQASEELSRSIIETKDYLHKIPRKGFHFLLLKQQENSKLKSLVKSEILYNFLGEIDRFDFDSDFSIFSLSQISQSAQENRKEYPFEINQFVKNQRLHTKITFNKQINSESLYEFQEIYLRKLNEVIDFCLGKETAEITQSDLSFDINSDDFENIFN